MGMKFVNSDRNAELLYDCRSTVESALNAGIDGFGFDDRAMVRKAKTDLQLDTSLAKDILGEVVRK